MTNASSNCFGIHIGNTSMSIALLQGANVSVLTNPDGCRVIPTMMAAHETELEVGMAAKREAIRNRQNALKYLVALSSVTTVKEREGIRSRLVAQTEIDDDGRLKFKFPGQEVDRVAAFSALFEQLRSVASSIDSSTPPPYKAILGISNSLLQSEFAVGDLVRASFAKGFQLVKIFPNCWLPPLVSTLDSTVSASSTDIVLHVGGVSIEVQCLRTIQGVHQDGGWKTIYCQAGESIVECLTQFLAEEFLRKYGLDPCSSARPKAKLASSAEDAVQRLSRLHSVQLCVESLMEGIDFAINLTRARFESVVQKKIDAIVEFVVGFANEACGIGNVNKIFLSGGSSQIPLLKQCLQQAFSSAAENFFICDAVEGDQVIAIGAAKQLHYHLQAEAEIKKHFRALQSDHNLKSSVTNGQSTQVDGAEEKGSSVVLRHSEYSYCLEIIPPGRKLSICSTGSLLPLRREFDYSPEGYERLVVQKIDKENLITAGEHVLHPTEKSSVKIVVAISLEKEILVSVDDEVVFSVQTEEL